MDKLPRNTMMMEIWNPHKNIEVARNPPLTFEPWNEIKWYFFDKKRARGEESRFIQGRASTADGGQAFGRVLESKRISPSTPSTAGWYWRKAYHMSLLCIYGLYFMKDGSLLLSFSTRDLCRALPFNFAIINTLLFLLSFAQHWSLLKEWVLRIFSTTSLLWFSSVWCSFRFTKRWFKRCIVSFSMWRSMPIWYYRLSGR